MAAKSLLTTCHHLSSYYLPLSTHRMQREEHQRGQDARLAHGARGHHGPRQRPAAAVVVVGSGRSTTDRDSGLPLQVSKSASMQVCNACQRSLPPLAPRVTYSLTYLTAALQCEAADLIKRRTHIYNYDAVGLMRGGGPDRALAPQPARGRARALHLNTRLCSPGVHLNTRRCSPGVENCLYCMSRPRAVRNLSW
eukprot:scaffold15885_cov68-Phaeocystis_antarctica.AAC.2